MKLIAILLFTILIPYNCIKASTSPQFYIKIEIKTTDCINCISYIQLLEKLNSKIQVSFIYKDRRDSMVIAELLTTFENIKFTKLEANVLKLASKGPSSMFYFLKDTMLIKSSPLNELGENLSLFNLISSTKFNFSVDSTAIITVFTDKSQLITSKNKKYIFDPFLNKIMVADMHQKNYTLLYKSNSDYNLELCKIAKLDTTRYIEFTQILKRYGKSNLRLNSVSINNNEIWATSTLTYPIIVKSDTLLENFYFLLKIGENNIQNAYYIKDSTLSNTSKYLFDDSNIFLFRDSLIYLSVYKENLTSSNYLISNWKIVKKELIYSKMESFELPNYYKINNHNNYNFASLGESSENLFLLNYPILYSINSSKTFDFKKLIENLESIKIEKEKVPKIYIYDCMVKKGIYFVAYNLNGKIKIITFDTNVDLISNLELPNYNTKSLKFFDFNMLVGINPSNGKEITIKIIPN